MKKIIFILVVLWLGLSAFANSVKAETKTETLIGHLSHRLFKVTIWIMPKLWAMN